MRYPLFVRPSQRARQTVEVFISLLLLASWTRTADAERALISIAA